MANTWDPANAGGNIVLSNGNHTATLSSVSNNNIYGTSDLFKSSGKLYFELLNIAEGNNGSFGFAPAGNPLTSNSITAAGVAANGSVSGNGGALASGIDGQAVVCFAVDFTNSKWWVRYGAGLWNNDATANPATNVGGSTFASNGQNFNGAFTAPFAPFCWMQCLGTADHVTLNAGDTAFVETVPSGFVPWNGTGPIIVKRQGLIIH